MIEFLHITNPAHQRANIGSQLYVLGGVGTRLSALLTLPRRALCPTMNRSRHEDWNWKQRRPGLPRHPFLN
jgi:hypothetical protein